MEVGEGGDYIPIATLSSLTTKVDSSIKVGSDESPFNVSLIVRDKVTKQYPQTTTFEQKEGPKPIRTWARPLLTSRTPYR